jgi:S1/P1 nuclease
VHLVSFFLNIFTLHFFVTFVVGLGCLWIRPAKLWHAQKTMRSFILLSVVIITLLAAQAVAWNPPTHIVSGAISYRILLEEPKGRATLGAIRPLLYAKALDRSGLLQRQTQSRTGAEADEMRFILTTGWADQIRNADPAQHRDKWHYINWPFKPEGEPASVVPRPPQSDNILTALAQNERVLQSAAPLDQRAVALAWLLHLVGDLHQPLHTAQLFTREYPDGDRGGNDICVRTAPDSVPMNLHMLWDGLITSSNDTRTLTSIAAELRKKFPKFRITQLASGEPKTWAEESFELATKTVYVNGGLRGTPKPQRRDCSEVTGAKVLPAGYAARAKDIAERRIVLAGYRLASLLTRLCREASCGGMPIKLPMVR